MRPATQFELLATCPKGLNYALESELKDFGAQALHSFPAGVDFTVGLDQLYRILMWTRLANRLALRLVDQRVETIEQFYQCAYEQDWPALFSENCSIAVDFSGTNEWLDNTLFGALKIKDAIVDKFRAIKGVRPNVDRKDPDILILARLQKGRLSLALDLAGSSLHKRAYRTATGLAPLKENLAAGLLRLASWPKNFSETASFVDPMCGSGTLLIEAAMLATDKAPGLLREKWAVESWSGHDDSIWREVKAEAEEKFRLGLQSCRHRFFGFDCDSEVIKKAWVNIQKAGFEGLIHVEKKALEELHRVERMEPGLILTNPPYGERLGEVRELEGLYQMLGSVLLSQFSGWRAAVFTGNLELGQQLGWHSHKQYKLFNGAIPSQLILLDLNVENRKSSAVDNNAQEWLKRTGTLRIFNEERAQMLRNRLLKNLKAMKKWVQREQIACYRLYDADMPEFSFALDLYQDGNGLNWLHIQEYAAPKTVDETAANERLREAVHVCLEVLDIPLTRCALKRREVKKGASQYEKQGSSVNMIQVREGDAKYHINLFDYLDTGLFLDHRPVRRWIRDNAKGKRFLNLFCYTASVTVSAVLGGAERSVSVDMSNTYLGWAKENFKLNGISLQEHELIQADCLQWLRERSGRQTKRGFDLILLDPPSFSNSKRMEGVLDIQRDHATLIEDAMQLLSLNGTLVFSNNLRKFKLDDAVINRFDVQDWSRESIDADFERNPKIHQCWMIRHR